MKNKEIVRRITKLEHIVGLRGTITDLAGHDIDVEWSEPTKLAFSKNDLIQFAMYFNEEGGTIDEQFRKWMFHRTTSQYFKDS